MPSDFVYTDIISSKSYHPLDSRTMQVALQKYFSLGDTARMLGINSVDIFPSRDEGFWVIQCRGPHEQRVEDVAREINEFVNFYSSIAHLLQPLH